LEDKVASLEKKIIILNEKLESQQRKISHIEIKDSRGHQTLSEAQDYWHNQLSEALINPHTSKEHLKDIVDYFVGTLGVAGSDRKKVVKNAIRVVIENLLPDSAKTILFSNKHELKANDKQLGTTNYFYLIMYFTNSLTFLLSFIVFSSLIHV
jgi:hypothetical protein